MNHNLERYIRMAETIALKHPTPEKLAKTLAYEPPQLNGLRRSVFCIGESFESPEGVFWFKTPQDMLKALVDDPGLPVPVIVLDCRDNLQDDELEKACQEAYRSRIVSVQGLMGEALKAYEGDIAKKAIEAGEKLRILFITSRFTSVLQYMCRDVAWGFKELGHQVDTLIEQSVFHRSTQVNTYKKIIDFKPHIIFAIDHMRPEMFPEELRKTFYFINWIQDDMPHLWNPDLTKRLWTHDWSLCMFPKIAVKAKYSGHTNVFVLPVAANLDIYQPGPINPDLACDIAFPCNIGSQRTMSDPSYAARRLDPVLWAMKIGLDIKVWGTGWDTIPQTRGIWMGPVENGPALAEVYRSAKFVLHANSDTNLHQRVFETAASHTVPLVYSHPTDNEKGGLTNCYDLEDHMVCFNDENDFIKKIMYYLNDHQARHKIAQNAYAQTFTLNSYKNRAEGILETIGWREGKQFKPKPEGH